MLLPHVGITPGISRERIARRLHALVRPWSTGDGHASPHAEPPGELRGTSSRTWFYSTTRAKLHRPHPRRGQRTRIRARPRATCSRAPPSAARQSLHHTTTAAAKEPVEKTRLPKHEPGEADIDRQMDDAADDPSQRRPRGQQHQRPASKNLPRKADIDRPVADAGEVASPSRPSGPPPQETCIGRGTTRHTTIDRWTTAPGRRTGMTV